jgi:hypothetical protein
MSSPIWTLLSSWSRSDSGPALTRGAWSEAIKAVVTTIAAEIPKSLRIGFDFINSGGTASNLTSFFIRISWQAEGLSGWAQACMSCCPLDSDFRLILGSLVRGWDVLRQMVRRMVGLIEERCQQIVLVNFFAGMDETWHRSWAHSTE